MNFDFPTILVALVGISGAIWAVDSMFFASKRLSKSKKNQKVPMIVDYARSFFPIFFIVLILRSFIAEPFRIPSNSMMPTLLTGDFILVNKFIYGIRLPVVDKKIMTIDSPERGDVVVFRYPKNPSTPFIKRVVGLPGDEVGYFNKTLYINGVIVAQEDIGVFAGYGSGIEMTGAYHRRELLPNGEHDILLRGGFLGGDRRWTVPPESYFVLGDNRDNSRDSRFWGAVAEEFLIGKAFAIWMNWDVGHGIDWKRIGTSIE